MWKILKALIGEEIYYLLVSSRLFSEELKGCHKGTRGTGYPLYIDHHIHKESKSKQRNVTMVWIDNNVTYDWFRKVG